MRFWLALFTMMLSLAAARAQVLPGPSLHELPELTPEEKAACRAEAIRALRNRRGCDNNGCYFYHQPNDAELAEEGCSFQKALQLRANEARRKLEAERAK